MSLTKVLITCALLMTGQTASDKTYTNLRSGRLPSTVKPDRIADIRELQLYMSADEGRSWNAIDKITPEKEGFTYITPADGEFWFKVLIVNLQGKSEPPDAYKGAVAMKLVVDTRPPELKIVSAQRVNDELVVEWQANDQNPDPLTLKIEYRPVDSQSWTAMPLTPNATGTARAHLVNGAPLVVRMSLWDLAKNFKMVEAQVPGSVAVAGYSPAPLVDKALNVAVAQPPLEPQVKVPELPVMPPTSSVPSLPPGHTALTEQPAGIPLATNPVASTSPANAASTNPYPAAPVQGGSPKQVIASSSDPGQAPQAPAQPVTQPAAPRGSPALQLVNDPEIVLEYEVSKVGPSGLKSVEVWVTRDGGANWRIFAEDEKAAEMTNGGKYLRTLRLPEDGVYGIGLVVKSKAGLGRPAPHSGDAPEMLVELDTVPPEGTLYLPVPDGQKRNTLILTWNAKDRNLGPTPITLEWSELPAGPWQPIAANLPNTGRYGWTLPPALPSHVYLKMTMKDAAGNVGVAVTAQPQLVDLSEPVGRLLSVTPLNKRQ